MTTSATTPAARATPAGTAGQAGLRTRLDRLLSRVSMYRLMVLALSILAALTVLFGATGRLGYRPAAMVTTLAVLLVVTYLSNRLFAALFQVRYHAESSAITALLLYLILQPTTDRALLAQIALAAVFASGSKYLLAIRGRHIFNPAAVGAVWLAVFHFYLALWWVASPVMLPFVAALALLVLYRTGRLQLAGVFLLVAGTIMIGRSMSDGSTVATAVTFAFAQTPAVFLAGFMLSEPLTLPPGRWQQLTVAAVVGVLFAVPITVGSFLFGPEAALIAGNALAFLFGQRRGIDLVLTAKRALTPTTTEFEFQPVRPARFRPGQYLELSLPHRSMDARGARRVFSISSAPADGRLAIAMKVIEGGSSFKRALSGLTVGEHIAATGISGDFRLPADPSAPVLLVAGGIGITPFASQLGALEAGHRRDIVVVYVAGSQQEVAYADLLRNSGARTVVITGASSATDSDPLPAPFDHLRGALDADTLAKAVPDITRRHVLVSGPPGLVDRISRTARTLKARSVTTDRFTGY